MSDIDANPRLVRDSFIMPREDHELIGKLIARVRYHLERDPTKNEILRIGLMLADEATTEDLAERIKGLKILKRGRPKGT